MQALVRGRLAIVGVLGIGLAGAAASVWYHYYIGRRALAFWGAPTANLIAQAPTAELCTLEPPELAAGIADADRVEIDGMARRAAWRKEISRAPGFGNVRRALLIDAALVWPEDTDREAPAWRYAVKFADGDQHATVLFGPEGQVAQAASAATIVRLDAGAWREWQALFDEQRPKPPAGK